MVNFGLYVRMRHNWEDILQDVVEAENNKFSSIWVNDHLIGFDSEHKDPYLEAWTLMVALAMKTKLRIGHTVLCNSFRSPSLLAKMASSLDVISEGRLDLAIGAGWFEREYQAYGFPFLSAKERVAQLRESLQIIKLLFLEEEVNFQGQFWKLQSAINNPKPVQKPHPPIIVGGEKPKVISIAAEFADGLNIPHHTIDGCQDIINLLHKSCEKIGRKLKDVSLSWFGGVHMAKSSSEMKELAKPLIKETEPLEFVLEKRMVGTPENIVQKLAKYIDELQIQQFMVGIRPSESITNPIEFFSDEVINQLV